MYQLLLVLYKQCLFLLFHLSRSPLLRLCRLAKDSRNALPDDSGGLSSVDLLPDTLLSVVVGDRARLLVVGRKSLLERLGVVIRALDELRSMSRVSLPSTNFKRHEIPTSSPVMSSFIGFLGGLNSLW